MTEDRPACQCVICHRDHAEAVDRSIADQVAERGWSVVRAPGDDRRPGWAFTVGIWHRHRRPELAIFGLEVEAMEACLRVLGAQTAEGWAPEPGHDRSHVIDGGPVLFKSVEPAWHDTFFGAATAFYRHRPVPFVQVLWADSRERFRTDPFCEPAARDRQPSLWLAPDRHPRGIWTS